jgi:hypothetical protein
MTTQLLGNRLREKGKAAEQDVADQREARIRELAQNLTIEWIDTLAEQAESAAIGEAWHTSHYESRSFISRQRSEMLEYKEARIQAGQNASLFFEAEGLASEFSHSETNPTLRDFDRGGPIQHILHSQVRIGLSPDGQLPPQENVST